MSAIAPTMPGAGTTAPAAAGERVKRPFALVRHSLTIAWRSLINTRRTPEALIDVTLQPALFLLIFTYIFGGAIAAGSQHDYLQYLLPGLLGQSIALGGVAIGVNLSRDLEKGIFDRFRSLPIGRSVPLVGAVIADVVRYTILTAVMLGFGYVLGFRVQTGVLPALAACGLAVAFALCFCWISVWIGMLARTSGAVQGIVMLIVFPLSFGSSTFVDPSTMPAALEWFAKVNPLSQLVDTVRALLLGGPVGEHLLWTLVSMVVLLVVFVPLALRAYARRT
jgi:oleandomycin transport system permease protein